MLAPPHLAQIWAPFRGHGGQQFADAKNIERPSQIIDEGGQTELGADFLIANVSSNATYRGRIIQRHRECTGPNIGYFHGKAPAGVQTRQRPKSSAAR